MFFLEEVCENENILRIIYFVWKMFSIVSFVLPIGAIIMISLDFARNVIANEADKMNKRLKLTIKRLIACVCFFLVPTVVRFTNTMLGDLGVNYSKCLEQIASGVTPSDGTRTDSPTTTTPSNPSNPSTPGNSFVPSNNTDSNKFSQSDVNKLKTKSNLKVVKKFTYKETNLVNKVYTSGNYTAAQTLVVFDNYYLVTQSSSASQTDTTIYTHIYNKESHNQMKTFKAKLGHSAGGTYNPNNKKIYFSWGHGTNYYATISKNNIISQKDVSVQKKSLSRKGNGWTFDSNTNKFYIRNGKVVYVYDEDFNYQKKYTILRSSGQDICNINGMLVNLVSDGQYLDFYRISDGKYLGTYEFPSKSGKIKLEMESCDYYGTGNKLLVLVNYGGASENGKKYDGVHLINVNLNDFK